ncbi:Zinc finger, C2H2 [Penicillium griseofulvum]|uniref:Zinc finger, C2H2 n=1 Tax=Penicillium patulum TaxID=5078 RepID=A0A135LPE3_PENPA|nr:Zinc finger, C2H2 [Penicillium griseofulvum]KXG50799.1 Zinc finger, C2H2 [Penicillium griseofulvum]
MPEAPLVTLNRCHVFICDIVIQGTQMCGDSFSNRATFSRHVRDRHADAEEIARTDAQFAAEYGIQFHRPGQGPSYACGSYLPTNQLMILAAPSTLDANDYVELSDDDSNDDPDFASESGSDCKIVSKPVSEVDFEPEDQEEWPVDAVTDIFAGLYLPSSRLDAAYGPMLEESD